MTTRQQQRLQLAERVCALVMRDHSCGFGDAPYRPDVVNALYFMQSRGEKEGALAAGSLHWLTEHGKQIEAAVFAWMQSVGIDPRSHEKAEAKRMALELAKHALGPEYEGEIEQLPGAVPWVERTAQDRADALIQEYASGKIHGHEELRIAIAADLLEAETAARAPFLEYCNVIFQVMEDARERDGLSEEQQKSIHEATAALLRTAARWMTIRFRPVAAADAALAQPQTPEAPAPALHDKTLSENS